MGFIVKKSFVLLSALIVILGATSVRAQSLADVAKQEEARRKAIKTPSKVYTDADLKKLTPAAPAAPVPTQPAPTPAATPENKEAQPGDAQANKPEEEAPEKTEAFWRTRITEARNRLARTKLLADAMQTRINSLTNDWVARDDPAQRAVLANQRIEALGELQRLTDEIVAQTKAIADIEEEARQAGIPPGWIR